MVAVISMLSAASPGMRARAEALSGLFPTPATGGADVLTIAISIGLLFFASGLRRRKHRAWQITVASLGLIAALHVIKGLDMEEAFIALLMLGALTFWRGEFYAEGDPATPRSVALAGVQLTVIGATLGFLLIEAQSYLNKDTLHPVEALLATVYEFVGQRPDRLQGTGDHVISWALVVYAMFAIAYLVCLWLVPRAQYVGQMKQDTDDARRLFDEKGIGTLDYFTLRRDKSYFFSDSRESFIGYRVSAGVALVCGDPIGTVADVEKLLESFNSYCHRHGWRKVFMGVSENYVESMKRIGLRTIYMGDEAIVNPRKFSLEGRRIRKVRQSCNRLKKAGFKVRVLYLPDITDGLRKQLDRITSEWLGGKGERGFSMQIDDIWAADRDDCVFAIAIDRDGIARGFAHFVPTALGRGLSLSTQRRRKNTPNGLQEFIFSELFAWAETKGYEEVSLNFSAMGEVLRSKKSDLSASQKLLRWIVIRADRFFQIQRLYRFNRKFLPEWRPRLIAYERYGDLPLGILVIMASESLIGTPKVLGKLNRSTAQ